MTSKKERMSGPDQIWVCGACGKTLEGDRYDMRDTACVLHAVLCHKEKVDGKWIAVESAPTEDTSSQ